MKKAMNDQNTNAAENGCPCLACRKFVRAGGCRRQDKCRRLAAWKRGNQV